MLLTFVSYLSASTNVWILSLVILLWALHWWKTPHPKFPPGRRGLPFVGVLPYLGDHPQEVFRNWAQDYGPVMFLRMGGKDVVFLNTVDSIAEVRIICQLFFMQASRITMILD